VTDQVLVLGAYGFVGTHLIKALVGRGDKVIAVCRQPPDARFEGIETVIGTLNEPEHFSPLIARCRAVVHLASSSTPGSSAGEALAELRGNLQPTLALLEALQEHSQTKLVYVSSGGSLYGNNEGHASTEDSLIAPRSYHGAGKVAAEFFIRAWTQQFAATATILRPSNIYGPGQAGRPGFGIIPAAMDSIRHGKTLPVWGDGSTTRDYLYVDDFTDLCLRVLDAPRQPGTIVVNAADGVPTSINELLTTLEDVAGRRLDRHYEIGRPVDAPRIDMDTALAQRLFNWKSCVGLREGLKRTWEWFNTCQH